MLVAAALAGGLLHAVRGFVPVLGLLPMQIHVGAALAAAGLLAAHVLPHRHRRWPLVRRVDLDRRTACRRRRWPSGGLALRAVAPGRERRFTGSHQVAALPVTQWLFDPVLALDPTAWRLRLPGRALDLAALAALPQTTVRAVIDCTGGWWAEEEWRGVLLADLGLPAIGAGRRVGDRLPAPSPRADGVLLATHAGGRRWPTGTAAPPGSSCRGGGGSGGSSGWCDRADRRAVVVAAAATPAVTATSRAGPT